jgi:hypothetical protein
MTGSKCWSWVGTIISCTDCDLWLVSWEVTYFSYCSQCMCRNHKGVLGARECLWIQHAALPFLHVSMQEKKKNLFTSMSIFVRWIAGRSLAGQDCIITECRSLQWERYEQLDIRSRAPREQYIPRISAQWKSMNNISLRSSLPQAASDPSAHRLIVKDRDLAIRTEKFRHSCHSMDIRKHVIMYSSHGWYWSKVRILKRDRLRDLN